MEMSNAHDSEASPVSATLSLDAYAVAQNDASLPSHAAEEEHSDDGDVQESGSPDADESQTSSSAGNVVLVTNAGSGPETTANFDRPRSVGQELGEWKYEMMAAFFSVSMAFAMLGTAFPFQEKPRPQWPIHISINALLSVYTVVFRGALMFLVSSAVGQAKWVWFSKTRRLSDLGRYDDASRGLWGSLKWLWSPGFREPRVALGALIVVVGIAIDPFIQQLVHYTDCFGDVAGNSSIATMPRTNFYDIPMYGISSLDVLFHLSSRPAIDVQTAVVSGFLSPPANVGVQCLTGNCTYGNEYGTIGFCSVCEDLSSQLDFSGACSGLYSVLDSQAYYCNITSALRSGLSINAVTNFANYTTRNLVVAGAVAANGFDESNSGTWEIIVAKADDMPATDPDTLVPYPDCANAATNDTWHCKGFGAATCSFRPCVRTYNASVSIGVLEESLLANSDPLLDWGSARIQVESGDELVSAQALIDTKCASTSEIKLLESAGYSLNASERWLPYSIAIGSNYSSNTTQPDPSYPAPVDTLLARGCVYLFPDDFRGGFYGQFLNGYLNGSLTATSDAATSGVLWGYQGTQIMLQLYNYSRNDFNTISHAFESAAESFTNYIRANGNANFSEPARGTVQHYAICVQIDWAWIALPAALAALAIALLVMSVMLTAKHQAPIWKSDLLPLIFHGPVGVDWQSVYAEKRSKMRKDAGSLNKMKAMSALAREVDVKLDDETPLLRLLKVDAKSV
jgi:hypothetical protein